MGASLDELSSLQGGTAHVAEQLVVRAGHGRHLRVQTEMGGSY